MFPRPITHLLSIALLLGATAGTAQAASVFLSPADQVVPPGTGNVTLELFMDFTGSPTVGGGIDLDLSGPISLVSFAPSSFFTNTADPAFSGFGTDKADADFEIHFGSFSGLSGQNKLGDLTLSFVGIGVGNVSLAINSFYGDFISTLGAVQQVTLTGAQVSSVPLPAGAWLLLTGVGALVGRRLRRAA
jgi:hypothetical protein